MTHSLLRRTSCTSFRVVYSLSFRSRSKSWECRTRRATVIGLHRYQSRLKVTGCCRWEIMDFHLRSRLCWQYSQKLLHSSSHASLRASQFLSTVRMGFHDRLLSFVPFWCATSAVSLSNSRSLLCQKRVPATSVLIARSVNRTRKMGKARSFQCTRKRRCSVSTRTLNLWKI